jgi:EAL domain-containing protein (putative c-di-GMP-specific phosphodiesterase class I)
LSVVAEGIEEPGQLAAVRELGFDIGQGFYFCKPDAADSIGRLLCQARPFGGLFD